LAVTWKVADGVYQHLDVLELQKDNEFSVGKLLRIGGKYTYSDLDELIVDHVKAMSKKVIEMMQHEKYQSGSKTETGKCLARSQASHITDNVFRELVIDIYGGQSETICVCFLLGS